MEYAKLLDLIYNLSNTDDGFAVSVEKLQECVYGLSREELIPLLENIGIIPESIKHDSTEEKLYSKASDIVLAKAFHELGLKSMVLKERADCADVTAKSLLHNYSMVADAKTFRLSRTAKNQKDFKVKAMVDWRGDNDYCAGLPLLSIPQSAKPNICTST